MATPAKAKPSAYEKGVREGAAMRKRGDKGAKVEIEISPEGEEMESPEEEMDGETKLPSHGLYSKTNRKRSAKGAKNTKAPMDGGMYGKKPMDAECGCMSKGRKGKCDGSCGKKMDALTPQEYLSACDLGIQGRTRPYIRARLDTDTRADLKCGKGAISEGEKCHVGNAQKAPQRGQLAYKQSHRGLKEEAFGRLGGRVLSNRQIRQIERGIVAKEARTGKAEKLSEAQRAALISTRGTASRKLVAAQLMQVRSKDLKRSVRATRNTTDPGMFAISRVAKRELFNRRVQTGANILGAGLAVGAITASTLQTRRGDSIYADGFSPDLMALAI